MRRVLSVLGVVSAVPVLLTVPVLTRPAPTPRPVAPHVSTVAMAAAPTVPAPAAGRVVARAAVTHTGRFGLVGAAWTGGAMPAGETVQLRTHDRGRWSSWTNLTMPDGGPDAGSTDARAAAARHVTATDPLWVGSADGVQARVVDTRGVSAAAPRGLHLVLVDGGSSSADASPGAPTALGGSVAHAEQAQPTIYTRSQWGADERLRSRNPGCGTPDYGSTIEMGFIHHTDTGNGYSSSSVPSIIRSIYAYHVESNGWCDIGYNFLVDRFGRIWEGRYGGISKPVIGAHTGGFNTNTFGTSLIGTYSSTEPSSAMLGAVERLFAWKLGSYYRNPLGRTTVVAGTFSGSRYATGAHVTFNVVSGHRNADYTDCPGTDAYGKLGTVRAGIVRAMGAGFVDPSISPATVRMLSGQQVAIHAGVVTTQSWTATVTDRTGRVVRTMKGTASTSTPVSVAWDGTGDDGLPVPPETYTVTLSGTSSVGTARPFSAPVVVTPPVTVSGPATAAYDGTATLTGTAAPDAAVTVSLQSAAPAAPPVTQTVTAASNGTWRTTFVADNDYTWSAASQGWSTSSRTTRVAPQVTLPAGTVGRSLFTTPGSVIALTGTALPGTTVSALGQPAVSVAADGTWTGLSAAPVSPLTVVVTDSRGLTSEPVTAYAVHAPTATAPTTGYSDRTLTVTGDAGGAPVSVQLWTKAAGAADYAVAKTVTAAAGGTYSVAARLPSVTTATPFAWRIVTTAAGTTYGTVDGALSVLPAFAPTISGPTTGYYTHAIAVHGTAVPGDAVTLWVRPTTSSTWTRMTTVTASASSSWHTTFTLWGNRAWRVTSASGTSPTGTTVVRPTLHVPTTAAYGARIVGWGYTLPRAQVSVYRRPVGTTTWRRVYTTTAASSGRWSAPWHLYYSMNVQARSNGLTSTTYTIRQS